MIFFFNMLCFSKHPHCSLRPNRLLQKILNHNATLLSFGLATCIRHDISKWDEQTEKKKKNQKMNTGYPSEENHSSLQVSCLGFLWVCICFVSSSTYTCTTETKQNLNSFPPEIFFIPEDPYASTYYSRHQNPRPALGFSTCHDTVLQCWIAFHSQWTVALHFFKRICYIIQQYTP